MSTDSEKPIDERDSDVTRREFLGTAGAAIVVVAAAPTLDAQQERREAGAPVRPSTHIRLTINGTAKRLEVDDHWTLAELLRDHLRLTGTKLGCERGECGACTVLIDGKPRYSCMTLAVEAEGHAITTVEGLLEGEKLGPVQQAFVEEDAFQCGFCTPGQIMAVEGLLRSNPDPTIDQIRTGVSGNLCRCGAYKNIFNAAAKASVLRKQKGGAA
jgi:xanthine dehydrogenase YagT iron-sulfur-binding subunit